MNPHIDNLKKGSYLLSSALYNNLEGIKLNLIGLNLMPVQSLTPENIYNFIASLIASGRKDVVKQILNVPVLNDSTDLSDALQLYATNNNFPRVQKIMVQGTMEQDPKPNDTDTGWNWNQFVDSIFGNAAGIIGSFTGNTPTTVVNQNPTSTGVQQSSGILTIVLISLAAIAAIALVFWALRDSK